MRVFFGFHFPSLGVGRVVAQLEKYLPADADFEITTDPATADLTVLHVIGRCNHMHETAKRIREAGHEYAVIQYALGSTRNPDPQDWIELWANAKVMWSYYDLRSLVPAMYHAPLGADPEVFYKENDRQEKYLVGVNANERCYQAECIGEARLATYNAHGRMVQIGERFFDDPSVDIFDNADDDAVRHLYNQCRWFSALRRRDGFEMVAVEALMCGTRPIMFDTPNYRQWFDGLAEFVPETSVRDTVRSLTKLLHGETRPVTSDEIAETKKRFDWETIIKEFWDRCR